MPQSFHCLHFCFRRNRLTESLPVLRLYYGIKTLNQIKKEFAPIAPCPGMETNKFGRAYVRGETLDPEIQIRIKKLLREKYNQTHIAKTLKLDRHTIMKYSRADRDDIEEESASIDQEPQEPSPSYPNGLYYIIALLIICLFASLVYIHYSSTIACVWFKTTP